MSLKRKTPLKAKKSLKRTGITRRPRKTRRADEERRDPQYTTEVRRLPCIARSSMTSCGGPIHAHHAGVRPGMGIKADDMSCIPLCAIHHHELHSLGGSFGPRYIPNLRLWQDQAVLQTMAEVLRRRKALQNSE